MGDVLRSRLGQERFESAQHEALLNLLVAAAHLRDRIERACAEHGITLGQYNVLRILRGVHPAGYPRCEIARRMIERAPDVTRLVDRLERRGWVARARSGADRRLSLTRITQKGRDLLERIQPAIDAAQADVTGKLTDEKAVELSRLCEMIYGEEPRSG